MLNFRLYDMIGCMTFLLYSVYYDILLDLLILHSFIRSLRAWSSLLWTPALKPFLNWSNAPGRGGESIGVCGVRAM